MVLSVTLYVNENLFYKGHSFWISIHLVTVESPMVEREMLLVIFACINVGCRKLITYTFHSILIGHHRCYRTLGIEPVLDVMLVSAFVVKPCFTHAGRTAAGTDGRTVALIIFYTLEELDG